jgi:hypothetical protein
MYDLIKKTKEHKQASKLVVLRTLQSNIIDEQLESDGESKTNRSRTSKFTGYSRITGDRRKGEGELIEKIYSAMKTMQGIMDRDFKSLIKEAIKQGVEIGTYQEKALQELLDSVGVYNSRTPATCTKYCSISTTSETFRRSRLSSCKNLSDQTELSLKM